MQGQSSIVQLDRAFLCNSLLRSVRCIYPSSAFPDGSVEWWSLCSRCVTLERTVVCGLSLLVVSVTGLCSLTITASPTSWVRQNASSFAAEICDISSADSSCALTLWTVSFHCLTMWVVQWHCIKVPTTPTEAIDKPPRKELRRNATLYIILGHGNGHGRRGHGRNAGHLLSTSIASPGTG
ncbi:hypothetical protein PISMIDRAFT_601635 [Pisolithus microcarpus 441]|uniref:Uncharacterized protein n=1 Tax=Pisolithus microcarpus 441 TaxID=765257 RepID=A0A0C9Z1D4_9AGAM|nr:hypothetical protein BKA83DRAFT_601635 [Pisolithus microcarpus]KIK20099.1 hypothetical protein PISMIDRAFT_601635 [Pisolithus microcarpus 441]